LLEERRALAAAMRSAKLRWERGELAADQAARIVQDAISMGCGVVDGGLAFRAPSGRGDDAVAFRLATRRCQE
jgi:hypothetical protein